MSKALKDRYNKDFFGIFSSALARVISKFNKETFQREFTNNDFDELELKQRMSYIATVLKSYLSADFDVACDQIIQCVIELKKLGVKENFEYMFLPEFIVVNGLTHFKKATDTLATTTHFTSSEFAVRPFIIEHPEKMIAKMINWSFHKDPKIRRLASEGCRPRLPWAIALPTFIKDPAPVLPILENLKNDSDEWVRRSVANHLNDISKDNPRIVIDLAHNWYGSNKDVDSVVKHACRGLLKSGHPEILRLFNLNSDHVVCENFMLKTESVNMGEHLSFEFILTNKSPKNELFRIEYVIYLLKKNGDHSKKVFKISERQLAGKESIVVSKKHHFKPITTRVYYSGEHAVAPIINGLEVNKLSFDLIID